MIEAKAIRNPIMCLITKKQMKELLAAGRENTKPIIKLFMGSLTWLVTEIDPNDGRLYGYADIGHNQVDFGSLCFLSDLPNFKVGPAFLERDRWFRHKEGTEYLKLDSLSEV